MRAEKIPPLILASASPQRKKLLKQLGRPFRVVPSGARETDPRTVHHRSVRKLVTDLAVKKAKAVARRFKDRPCAVLGADTLVVCRGRILGKPRDEADARRMLRLLSGSRQTIWTGLCFIVQPSGRVFKDAAATTLRFKKLDEATVRALAGKNLDKSGSYAIQKINDRFVREIRGDLDNVIGLPLRRVRKLLKKIRGGRP